MSRALGVLVSVIALLALPTPAGAAPWSGDDAAGDVQAVRIDPAHVCSESPVDAAVATSVDITRITVQHRPHVLVVRLRHAGSDATDSTYLTLHVLTPSRQLSVGAARFRPRGRWHVDVGDEPDWAPTEFDDDGDGTPDCDGWSALTEVRGCRGSAVTVAGPLLTLALPRACLGSPPWVRIGATEGVFTDDIAAADTWGTSDLVADPNTLIYGARVGTGRVDTADTSRTLRGPVVRRTLLQSPAGLVLPTS